MQASIWSLNLPSSSLDAWSTPNRRRCFRSHFFFWSEVLTCICTIRVKLYLAFGIRMRSSNECFLFCGEVVSNTPHYQSTHGRNSVEFHARPVSFHVERLTIIMISIVYDFTWVQRSTRYAGFLDLQSLYPTLYKTSIFYPSSSRYKLLITNLFWWIIVNKHLNFHIVP